MSSGQQLQPTRAPARTCLKRRRMGREGSTQFLTQSAEHSKNQIRNVL